MNESVTVWIHPSTYTFSYEEPANRLETLYVARPGWGYLMVTDLWVRVESQPEELHERGFVEKEPLSSADVFTCPHCGMYVCGVPGYLVQKHLDVCGGNAEDHLAMEDSMISDIRRTVYERKILAGKQQEQEEMEAAEKKERFDRIREDAMARQLSKDRKKRMKQELRDQIKKK
jgi:hypothetical protein